MIHVVVGTPGAGKSYYLLRQLAWYLAHTDMVCATNLRIFRSRLRDYFLDRQIEVDLDNRLFTLTDEQVREFWRWRAGKRVDSLIGVEPCLYCVQEGHQYFGVRDWATLEKEAVWYLSQHRKLCDEIWLDCQHPDQLVKQIRIVAQDWTVLRNWGLERWRGFRAPRRFRWVRTLEQPRGGAVGTFHESGMFPLDLSLARCYDTLSGVGIGGADHKAVNQWVRGVPWYVGLGLILGIAGAVLYYGPWLVGRLIGFGAQRLGEGAIKVSGRGMSNAVVALGGSNLISFSNATTRVKLESDEGKKTGRLTMLAGIPGKGWIAGLDTGETFTPDFVSPDKRWVLWRGVVYSFAR